VGGNGDLRVGDPGGAAVDAGKVKVLGELGVGEMEDVVDSVPVLTGSSLEET
jgi:hypothetical protein